MSQSPTAQSAHELSDLHSLEDLALALRASQGEQRAFAELLRRHGAVMKRTAFRRTQNSADADDVVQETALKAWQSLATLRDPARIRSWLLQITDRRALTLVVLRQQEHELAEWSASVAGPEHDIERFDLQEGVRTALHGMPRMQARAWILREVDDLSYRQIAEELDASESTVRGWLVLARKRVRRDVEKTCPEAPPSAQASASSDAQPLHTAAVVQPTKSPLATYPPVDVEDGHPSAELRSPIHQNRTIDPPADLSRTDGSTGLRPAITSPQRAAGGRRSIPRAVRPAAVQPPRPPAR